MSSYRKLVEKKRMLLRKFFGLFSFTALMFVFQACYGCVDCDTPDFFITGTVTSNDDGEVIGGIEVSLIDGEYVMNSVLTDNAGQYKIYTYQMMEYNVRFADIDSLENGHYLPLDTTLNLPGGNISGCTLNAKLMPVSE